MDNALTRKFDLNRPDYSKWVLLFLVLVSLAAVLYVQFPMLQDPYAIGDDLRHMYWMNGYQDPGLFPNDYLTYEGRYQTFHLGETRLIIENADPGYSVLFYLASFLVDPVTFSKILPFILMPVYVTYLFKIGQRLKSNTCGLLLGLLGIAFGLGFPGSIRTGYQRGFAFPLTAMLLYYMIVESSVGVAVSLVLQGLLYVAALPVSFLAYLLSWVRLGNGKLRVDLSRKKIVTILIPLLITAVVLYPMIIEYGSSLGMSSDNMPADQEHTGLLDNPIYGPQGRVAVFAPNRIFGIPLYVIVGFVGLIPNYGVAANLAPLFLLCGLIFLILGSKSLRLGWPVWSLFISGLLLFIGSWVIAFPASAFVLNMPNKYVKVTIPLWTILFIAFNLEDFVTGLLTPRWKRWILALLMIGAGGLMLFIVLYFSPDTMIAKVSGDNQIAVSSLESLARLRDGILFMGIVSILLGVGSLILPVFRSLDLQRVQPYARVVGVVLFVLAATWMFFPTLQPVRIEIAQEEREIIQYATTLPKDVMISGAPQVLDNIPLLAKRQVTFSLERLSEDKQLIIDSFDAYYAESGQEVLDFCGEYGIDYWVVDIEQFEEPFLGEQRFFYDPFNDEIIERIQGRSDFVFSQIPDNAKLFESENLFVVKCDAATFAGLE